EIGNLTNLDGLYLVNNQLRSMPSGIGNLTNLINIYLRYNEFTSIPIELFELKQLSGLGLSGNQLTSIPPEIGNLTNLRELYLASNELTRISPEIDNLTNMLTLTVAYNRIVSADNNTLTAFLNQKDSDWLETQTVPPQNVAAEVLSPNSVKLSWTPIAFRDKGGYYEISVAKDGIYSIHNVTYNKDDNTYVVSGLVDDTNYTFRIRTYTPRHDGANTDPSVTKDDQLNELWSEYGDVITVRTLPKLEDDYEADNQCHIARLINPDSPPQPHTFHATADTDWVQFTAPTAGIYRIEATIPDGSRADVDLFYYSDCDAFHEDKFVETFAPGARIDVEAEAGQSFYIKVKHVDPMVYGPDVTYSLSVRRMLDETDDKGNVIIPGPAIVVAGRYSGADPAQGNIDETARYAYDLFTAKGRNESEIFFLATDSSLPGYDGEATKRNLEYGITQWAKEYLQKEHVSQVLTLYLVDHGGPDEFYLDRLNEEVLTANDLDTWLSELEDEFPDLLVNVIIEACRAGSFINRRNGSISSEGRVIITSSNQDYDAYVSRHGAAFSDEFISFLWTDHSLFYSFQASSHSVQQHHRYQRPWLDADGDGDPNEAEDFAIASLRSFANAGTLSSSWPPYIAGIDVSTTDASSQPQFHADVRHEYGNESIQEVWGVVYPPDYIQPTGEAAYEDDGELNAESLDIIEFTATDEAQYISDGSVDGKTVFTQMGVYRIVVYARDRDGLQARPVTVEVDTVALNGHRIFLPTVSR
ncbi:MAG: leucine-rich repeat domain-containing protein, partial [Chloroflexota bacterium]